MTAIIEFSGICRHLTWSCLEKEHDYCDDFEFVKGDTTYHLTLPHCCYPAWGRVRNAADYVEEVAGDQLLWVEEAQDLLQSFSPGNWCKFQALRSEAFRSSYTLYYWKSDVECIAKEWEVRCTECGKPFHEWVPIEATGFCRGSHLWSKYLTFKQALLRGKCSKACEDLSFKRAKREEVNAKRRQERERVRLAAQKLEQKERLAWLRRAQSELRLARRTIREMESPRA